MGRTSTIWVCYIKYLFLYVYNYVNASIMMAANYSEFRGDLKRYLDQVENNHETLIIKRGKGKGAVMISLDEYNSLMETVHLLSSKENADRLYESIQQMKDGDSISKDLIKE
jgi:antitoxin YefM